MIGALRVGIIAASIRTVQFAPANITQAPVYAIIGLPPLVKVTQAPVYAISQPAPELKVTQVPVYAIITL